MSARESIMTRLPQVTPPPHTTPVCGQLSSTSLVDAFIERAQAAQTHVERISATNDFSSYVDQLRDGPTELVVAPLGIAEFGCVVLIADETQPTIKALLPDTLIVVVSVDHLVLYLEDAWPLLSQASDARLILGPSRTGDIEQTMELGAHGPKRMIILLME
jgi:L-lactate utilization protein LutC